VKRIAAILIFLLLFGAVKLPLERQMSETHRTAYFHGAKLNLSLREQIGQGAFLAALSGFRGVIADVLVLEANTAWENTQWDRVALLYDQITTLQPRQTLFWKMAADYLIYDAAAAALQNDKEPRMARRVKASRAFMQEGRDFLERGLRNNPDRWELYEHLGHVLMIKIGDHYGAYQAYTQAARFPDCLGYERRFAAYELSKCPGHEREAYDLLKKLYGEGNVERTSTLMKRLEAMEEKLGIPPEQRVYKEPLKNP
jgi:hypothetical protein